MEQLKELIELLSQEKHQLKDTRAYMIVAIGRALLELNEKIDKLQKEE